MLSTDNCGCCGHPNEDSFEINVLPGIGHYYGWHFKASIDNVFVLALSKIFNKLLNYNYEWIIYRNIYQGWIKPGASENEVILVSRLGIVVFTIISVILAYTAPA
ncbi:MAG: hypothetical protein QXX12_02260, partial [Nanopusillaceae archaeon]